MIELPEWIDKSTWADFEDMRMSIKKPLRDPARRLAVKRLLALYAEGNDPQAVLEQSILNAWQGLWPVCQGRRGRRDEEVRREVSVGAGPSAYGHVKEKY